MNHFLEMVNDWEVVENGLTKVKEENKETDYKDRILST